MSMINKGLSLVAMPLLLVVGGCASTSQPAPEAVVEAPVETQAVAEVVEVEPIPAHGSGRKDCPAERSQWMRQLAPHALQGVFYFDFDQAIVRRDGHAELDQHAGVLANNPRLTVRLEGHADERGTREYNLALGERRANAVQSYLLSQGASRSQIEVVSYGEEKPAMSGHDQMAWEKNRRVEIVYR